MLQSLAMPWSKHLCVISEFLFKKKKNELLQISDGGKKENHTISGELFSNYIFKLTFSMNTQIFNNVVSRI